MFPIVTKQGGQALGAPDVCKTPSPGGPVPIPYPNMAMSMQLTKGSTKTKVSGMPAAVMNSEVPMSSGNEAGTAGGGVVSNCFKGKCVFKMGSMKVKIEGKNAMILTSMVGHNGANANMPAGTQIAPAQVLVTAAK